jgi:hypothetical protein
MANLTEKMGNIWKEAKKQPKDIWFFYLFLLTFTLGVRKVILYLPLKGAFNEYTGAYVYASDIFLYFTIVAWFISILYNKIVNKSMGSDDTLGLIHKIDYTKSVDSLLAQKLSIGIIAYIKALFSKLFHPPTPGLRRANVEHSTEKNNTNCSTWNNLYYSGFFLIPLLLVIWSFASVFWSESRVIGVYRAVKFLELYLVYLYVAIRFVPYFLLSLNDCSTWNNLRVGNVENVPPTYARALAVKRGTFSNAADGDDAKLFHLPTPRLRQAGVEQFNYVFQRIVQYFRAILLGLAVIALFDHYLWDIWQGQVLFWLICGILAGFGFVKYPSPGNCSTWNNLRLENTENVPRGTFNVLGILFAIIVLIGVVQSLIGIAQFVVQHSLGLFSLKESLVGQDIPGVAKIVVNYHPVIRAYGLFPHPNLLGGFLFFSIIVTMLYKKMFHVEHFDEQNNANCSTSLRQSSGGQAWNNLRNKTIPNVPRGTIGLSLIKLVLAIQAVGIILSFSKAAVLALVIAFAYINVPRGTIRRISLKKMFHVEHFRILLALGLAVLTGLFFLRVEFYALFVKSIVERGLYLSISERIIADNPIIGVGTGQFIMTTERLFSNLEIWQYQPVHNVFLLIWSEWGIVGLVLFILFLWKLFHANVPRGTFGKKQGGNRLI